MPVAGTSTFLSWFQIWGQVAYICVHILYLIAVGISAVVATIQAKRFVDHVRGSAKTSQPQTSAPTGSPTRATISVEEFVD